ncbi:hypothetical protein MPSEU_000256600 [Mayamaea pseudoterrestris]|nr:hypothetical protein MPSEU_000256600 [Mayamaea pseudoterrestris]
MDAIPYNSTMRLPLQHRLLPVCLLAEFLACVSSFTLLNNHPQQQISRMILLHAATSDSDHVSAAARARREEESRRLERREDVIVGQTSAKPGAKDFEINSRVTEQAWLSQASQIERQVYEYTERGMNSLKMLQIENAVEYFDRVFQLRPQTYLWQAGVAKFYMNDLEGAADIFTRTAQTYESLFGESASEERIWRNACLLKMYSSKSRASRKVLDEQGGGIESLLSPMPEVVDDDDSRTMTERRKVMRLALDLFSSSVRKDFAGVVLSRAKLRAIGGRANQSAGLDRKMWKLTAWYYLGLHYDVLGEREESKRCMKTALKLCPSIGGNADDIVHSLPLIHMTRRDFFDDDDMETDASMPVGRRGKTSPLRVLMKSAVAGRTVDPIVAESIEDSLLKMRHADLKAALKERGLLCNGMKEELLKRMFQTLIEEVVRLE